MTNKNNLNEECIKNQIVVPALLDLGFKLNQLMFETSVSVNLPEGTKTLFADIVVNNEFGLPVLVIEIKRWKKALRSDDVINQVRSYATGLGKSVIYAIATNGRDITLVDMMNGAVQKSIKQSGISFTEMLRLELNRRIKSLPGAVDADSVLCMSKNKTLKAISFLKSPSELIVDQKYIPELYVDRNDLSLNVANFISSDQKLISIVGDAGFGKTNFLCSTAESLCDTKCVLFYNGFQLYDGISKKLRKDLHDIVAAQDIRDGLERLSCVPSLVGEPLFIFIDAINECSIGRDKLLRDLDELVELAESFPIKLIVSCRTQDWDNWLRPNGKGMGLFGYAIKGASHAGKPSVLNIHEFNDIEFTKAWDKYRKLFGLIGEPSSRLKRLCLEPFMLRVVAEVYRNGKALPNYIEPICLFRRYFEEKYTTIDLQQGARRFLYWLVRSMLSSGNPHVRYLSVPLDQLGVCDNLLDERILLGSYEEGGQRYIIFTYELFLEFIISEAILHDLSNSGPLTRDIVVKEISSLRDLDLINIPGVIENIILSTAEIPDTFCQCLKLLVMWGGKWEAIAVSAIKKNEHPSADIIDIMLQLSCSTNYVIRLFLAQALGRFLSIHGDGIINLLTDSEHWEVRETAANIIASGNILAEGRKTKLIRLMNDFHWRVRRATGYAIYQLVKRGSDSALGFWSSQLVKIRRKTWREKYAITIGLLGRDIGYATPDHEALLLLASDANRQVRWAVANYAHRYRIPNAEILLRNMFRDSDEWVRRRTVLSTIEGMASGSLQFDSQFLLEMSADGEEAVRVALARNLGQLAQNAEVRQILRFLLGDAHNVAFAAYRTLSTIGDTVPRLRQKSTISEEILDLRERVARKEVDERTSRFHSMNEYIARRSEYIDRNDPYMQVIDTMCSIIASSVTTLGLGDIEPFLLALEQDPDEGVRWAFVMFLIHYDQRILDSAHKLAILTRLSNDNHWWVRREVALAVGVLGTTKDLLPSIDSLLSKMKEAEFKSNDDCSDEVQYFLDVSTRHLMKR